MENINCFKPENSTRIIMLLFLTIILSFGLTGAGTAFGAVENSTTCLNNTAGEGECKDCCDCLEDPEERQACRENCMEKAGTTDGFSGNTDLVSIDAPSVLGPDGDYSTALSEANEQDCKTYCDESDDLECGDRRYCRDACNAAFSGSDDTPDNNDSGDSNISIDQAVSDEAQMKTIAFDGLAFLTGDLCSDTFFPPGKVSDFFGFQYRRDITPNGFGHNTEFAGKISDNVLGILTDSQVDELVALANEQAELVEAYAYKRFVLIKAFRRQLENSIPDGTTGLSVSAIKEFSADLYEIDGEISYARAEVIGGIVSTLTSDQKAALVQLETDLNTLFETAGEGGNIDQSEWPSPSTQADLSGLTVNDGRVLVSTYAGELFSWYLGSVDGDTYFCPERHGTYFGSFYMKDIPPISATEAVTIDSNLTADMGTDFLNTLNTTQQALITGLVTTQKTSLMNIVSKRAEIAEKLRLFMEGTTVDKSEVLALIRQYGQYDGEIIYHYAVNFSSVKNSLTESQENILMGLRTDYYSEFPEYQANSSAYDCTGAWLYSARLDEMPEIDNTDFLFGTNTSVVIDGAVVTLISDGFDFAEGPASDIDGNIFFSDIANNIIYKWTEASGLSVFRKNSGGANGLFFDIDGSLLACEGANQQIVSMDSAATVSIVTSDYSSSPFNEPNDLWVDPDGGIYFTDPVYFASETSQDGEHVYYISPDHESTVRVIDDMVRPNGIVGTPDGETLYVTDHGAGETYSYSINSDGTLSSKSLFISEGGDGMTIDNSGNVYLCIDSVMVYSNTGSLIESISVPDQPTNVCFGGSDYETLYITTRSALYSLKMSVTDDNSIEGNEDVDDDSSSSGSCFITSVF